MKAIFFDRDGVINHPIIRDDSLSSPRYFSEFMVKDDFIIFFHKIKKLSFNFKLFVVTNQPDISRGFLDKEELQEMHKFLYKNFSFDEIFYCPHDDHHNCNCRKPKPGLINEILERHSLSRKECIFVGDTSKDLLAGTAASIDTYIIENNYFSSASHSIKDEMLLKSLQDLYMILKDKDI